MSRFLFLIVAVSLFFACSTETTSNSSIETDLEETDSLSVADQEFFYNYELLSKYYYWSADEMEHYSAYYDVYIEGEEYGNILYMYSTLSDDFTYYITPDLLMYFIEYMLAAPSEVGTGIEVNDSLKVVQVYSESPAALSGVEKGDVVFAVDGVEIKQKETFDRLAKGEEGDEINLTLLREEDTVDVVIALGEYLLPTVIVDSIGGVPRIRISEFTSETIGGDTYREFLLALQETNGASATIIDLRGNPGGEIELCMDMASELLHKDDTLAIMRNVAFDEEQSIQYKEDQLISAATEGMAADRYVVFLADSNSASCSEIMLAAVTQNKASPIIGDNTYGKGIMQNLGLTPAEGLYSITTAEFLDKNGTSIHRKGFEPDFYSYDEDEILAKALEFIEVEQKREAGYGSTKVLLKTTSRTKEKIQKPGAYRFIGDKP